jgi:hypothetical protein
VLVVPVIGLEAYRESALRQTQDLLPGRRFGQRRGLAWHSQSTKEDAVTTRFSRIAVGLCLIGAPLLTLVSALVSPQIKSDEAAQVAVIAAHSARYYEFALFTLLGAMLLVPALLGLMHLTRKRAPTLGNVGGSLALAGTLIAIGDATTQLLVWQMGAPGADPAQMAELLKRYDAAAGSSLPFTVGGLALIAGVLILSVGLYRARAVPAWAAVGFVVGIVLNIAGFTAASTGILIVSSVILLAALGVIGWTVLGQSDDAWSEAVGLPLRRRGQLAGGPAGETG